jgi:hypothetical protein
MTKLRTAAAALAIALALTTVACSARPAYANVSRTTTVSSLAAVPSITVRLWRHKLTEPGDLGVTIRATSCITVTGADVVRDGGRYIVYSSPQHERGKTIVLKFRFTRHASSTSPTGAKPGPWNIGLISFYACSGDPEGVPYFWSGGSRDHFYVHAHR